MKKISALTQEEEKLINKISDENLKLTLILIRHSVEKLWGEDSPRIIQGFTNHGIQHCNNLIKFSFQILNANKKQKLNDEELFLLLASIFLHDCGMQCDFVMWPEILKKSIALGAHFEKTISCKNISDFDISVQKEIRENHHIISAAWIDFSFNTGKTIFGDAMKHVPYDLIEDLMDICKYHSKFDIENCDIDCHIVQGRKLLVASLLRLSDELDVDKNRVSITTVLNFSIKPENAFYWWLHYFTSIKIMKNIISIRIVLNSKDYIEYKEYIKNKFIDAFFTKNKPLLDKLNIFNFQMGFDANSIVVASDYADTIPQEICTLLKNNSSNIENIDDLLYKRLAHDLPAQKDYLFQIYSDLRDSFDKYHIIDSPEKKYVKKNLNEFEATIYRLDFLTSYSLILSKKNVLLDKSFKIINFNNLVYSLMNMFQTESYKKGVQIFYKPNLEKNTEPILKVNSLFNFAFINIINNAIQYSAIGTSIIVSSQFINSSKFIISVENIGLPIYSQDKNNIFEIGFRSLEAIKHSFGGNGLGLHFAKIIIENSNGCISFQAINDIANRNIFGLIELTKLIKNKFNPVDICDKDLFSFYSENISSLKLNKQEYSLLNEYKKFKFNKENTKKFSEFILKRFKYGDNANTFFSQYISDSISFLKFNIIINV